MKIRIIKKKLKRNNESVKLMYLKHLEGHLSNYKRKNNNFKDIDLIFIKFCNNKIK